MPPSYCFLPSNGENKRAIHVQSGHAGAACRRETDDALAIPPKMQPPGIQTGMKQCRHFAALRIQRLKPRSFAQRAGDTRECKIIQFRHSASGHRNDMVNMKRGFLRCRSKAAILAPILRPFPNLPPQTRRDGHAIQAGLPLIRSARRRSSDNKSATSTSPSASRFSSAVSFSPASCLSSDS